MTRSFVPALALLALGTAHAGGVNHIVTVAPNALSFSPPVTNASIGDTVTFNKAAGSLFHNVASDAGAPQTFRCAQGCDGAGGDGGATNAAWSATISITASGTIGYHCEIHGQGMTGSIVVGTPVGLQNFEID
jgi:plastocyanin